MGVYQHGEGSGLGVKNRLVRTVANWRLLPLFKEAAGSQVQLRVKMPYYLFKKIYFLAQFLNSEKSGFLYIF